jgi:hypothetical protein
MEHRDAGVISEKEQVGVAKAGADDFEIGSCDLVDGGDDLFEAEIWR